MIIFHVAKFRPMNMLRYAAISFLFWLSLSCSAAEVDTSSVSKAVIESQEVIPGIKAEGKPTQTNKANEFSSGSDTNISSSPQKISVNDAIELARSNSPQLKHREIGIQRQQLSAELASLNYSTDFDLQVSANIGKSRSELDLYDQNSRRHFNSVTLQATMPWWYKAEYKFDEKIAKVGKTLANNNYEMVFRRLDVDIYIAYFDAVLQQSKIHVQKTLADVSKQRLDNTVKSFELGRASQWSKVNDESNYLTQLAALRSSETDLLQKVIKLSNLIGVPLATNVAFVDDLPLSSNVDVAKTLNLTPEFDSDPNVKQVTLQLQQKQLEVEKLNKTVWKPKLSFKASYVDENQYDLETDPEGIFETPQPGRDASQYMVGATLNVPIPTFSENHAKKSFALNEIEDLKTNIAELKRTRLIDIANKKATLKMLNGQLTTYAQLVKKNSDEAEFAHQSFEIGKLTSLELQNIESLQVQSAEEYYETLFNIRRNYAELCWLLNAPIE